MYCGRNAVIDWLMIFTAYHKTNVIIIQCVR